MTIPILSGLFRYSGCVLTWLRMPSHIKSSIRFTHFKLWFHKWSFCCHKNGIIFSFFISVIFKSWFFYLSLAINYSCLRKPLPTCISYFLLLFLKLDLGDSLGTVWVFTVTFSGSKLTVVFTIFLSFWTFQVFTLSLTVWSTFWTFWWVRSKQFDSFLLTT